jgi:drug/metabolite transporter (DMT)-like permease
VGGPSSALAAWLLALVSLVWGATFVLIKEGTEAFPVLPFVALRFGLAVALLAPLAWRRRARLGPRTLARGGVLGLFMFGTYGLQTAGLQWTTASNSGLITGTYVVIAALLEAALFGVRLPVAVWGAVALAMGGLAALAIGPDFALNPGDALTLGCAVTIALHIVWAGRFTHGEDSVLLTTVQLAVVAALASVASIPDMFAGIGPPPPETWRAVIFCAVLATVFAYWVQMEAQKLVSTVRTALIFALEPVFALAFGVALGGDVLTPRSMAGAGLVLCGIFWAEWARAKEARAG